MMLNISQSTTELGTTIKQIIANYSNSVIHLHNGRGKRHRLWQKRISKNSLDGEKDCRIEEGREVCDDGPARAHVRSDCSGLIERVCFGIEY